MTKKLITSFGTFLERNCTIAITLAYLHDAATLLGSINKGHDLTLDSIRLAMTGISDNTDETFIGY